MALWNSKDAESATGGDSTRAWEALGVSIDSRKVAKGDLFIAIIGENQDGHKYVKSALENGAAAAMVNYVPEDVAQDAPLLVVSDTTKALWDLGKFSRERIKGKVAMVTGSVGKTSTKEMLAHTLEKQGKVHATIGNLNNHYGLPLTLSRMPAETDYAILEVGMSSPGEISPLSVLGKPDVAIITNVEPVHLEFFDSVEGIADAKAEVFDGLSENGTVVLNRDNAHFLRLKETAKNKSIKNILCFGRGEGADYRLDSYEETSIGGAVKATCRGKKIEYTLAIPGSHQAGNSLGVLAVVEALGADITKAAASLANFEAKAGRGKRSLIKCSFGEITIIDDTYNASPASVGMALETLGKLKKISGSRIIAVLGDMFELGDTAEELHKGLLLKITDNNVDMVFTAGKLTQKLYEVLPEKVKGGCAESSSALASVVLSKLKAGDIVLVKGSRGMRMENVVNYIIEEGQKKNAV